LKPGQIACSCGEVYWPRQRWAHEKCVVVNAVASVVVNARTKDRHKKTPERLEYVKQKMREYRKRRAGLSG
jgi:hypothetical protein